MTDDVASTKIAARLGLGIEYWRLWTADGLSNLADGVLKVALPLVAVHVTRSPTAIAGLTFAFTLPWLLFALPAGALVDRLDRRRAMLAANVTRATLVAALVLMTMAGVGSIWALYAVAICVGAAETIYDTSALSIVPQIVSRDRLSRANARLYAVELTANEFVGPPLAGLLVAAGAAVAFVTPVGLWALAIGALLLVRGRFRIAQAPAGRPSLRTDIAEGLRFLWRNRLLRTTAMMVGAFNFASNATYAILVLYAVGPASAMRLSGAGFGLLLATGAAGSFFGSLVAERIERRLGRARTIAITFAGGAALLAVPAVTANVVVVGAAFFVDGAFVLISNVVLVSLRQRITPDRLLGRITSSHRLVGWGTMPLGAAAGGLLAQLLGLRAVFAVMGLVAFLVVGAGLTVLTDNAMTAAEQAERRSRLLLRSGEAG
jgi:MFS family permease